MIFIIYWFVATSGSGVKLYNYWAIFAVELFVLIFWLCTFALVASKAALLTQALNFDVTTGDGTTGSSNTGTGFTGSTGGSSGTVCYSGYCVNYKRSLLKRTAADPFSATLYTSLALSVINL
jgi:hypothetical protein